MENKKFFALWLLAFGGCTTVVKQNMDTEDAHSDVPSVIAKAIACGSKGSAGPKCIHAFIQQMKCAADRLDQADAADTAAVNGAVIIAKTCDDAVRAAKIGSAARAAAARAAAARAAAARAAAARAAAANDFDSVSVFNTFVDSANAVSTAARAVADALRINNLSDVPKDAATAARNAAEALKFLLVCK
ncbi:hypothetical protein [Cardinium endosymbiont of Sogatella furcifera]|uniref:hypothetical protein n=1 Tax=Cardinium endosymbiont of Sogatella furcifera TaxID=650378 RepID=UPI000E0DD15D|nr:hypothetical protein [Cardinium endosymbiont of Sogatella furcifera]